MPTPKLFDAHTHVQFAAFAKDADLVIKRALGAGIWLVNVGTQKDTSKNAIELAHKYPEGVYASVGLHPIHTEKSYHDAQELGAPEADVLFSNSRELENKGGGADGFTSRAEVFDYDYYKNLAENPRVVAIGECGLDYYRITNDELRIKKQKETFIKQIELAREVKKPLMIHCREAFKDLIEILKSRKTNLNSPAGIAHFFGGTKEDADKLLDLGFYFTFGGVITFTRDYDEIIKHIPLDRILLETDAPYVAPVPYRGHRNEPLYIAEVAKKAAEIKEETPEKISEETSANAEKIFGLLSFIKKPR